MKRTNDGGDFGKITIIPAVPNRRFRMYRRTHIHINATLVLFFTRARTVSRHVNNKAVYENTIKRVYAHAWIYIVIGRRVSTSFYPCRQTSKPDLNGISHCKNTRRFIKPRGEYTNCFLVRSTVTHAQKRIYLKTLSLPITSPWTVDSSCCAFEAIHFVPDPSFGISALKSSTICDGVWGKWSEDNALTQATPDQTWFAHVFWAPSDRSGTGRRYNRNGRNRSQRQTRRTFVRRTVNITIKEHHTRVLVWRERRSILFPFFIPGSCKRHARKTVRKQIYRVTGIIGYAL